MKVGLRHIGKACSEHGGISSQAHDVPHKQTNRPAPSQDWRGLLLYLLQHALHRKLEGAVLGGAGKSRAPPPRLLNNTLQFTIPLNDRDAFHHSKCISLMSLRLTSQPASQPSLQNRAAVGESVKFGMSASISPFRKESIPVSEGCTPSLGPWTDSASELVISSQFSISLISSNRAIKGFHRLTVPM